MVTIVKDRDLIYDVFNYDVIVVGTSIMNALGNGFQKKIAVNFPLVNEVNKSTKYGDIRKLGTVKVVQTTPIFCLCYINKGRASGSKSPVYIDYNALRSTLELVKDNFKDKKIATTLIGCSQFDGNGDKEKVLDILNEVFIDSDITIYDYEQIPYNSEKMAEFTALVEKRKNNEISYEEYLELKKKHINKYKYGIYATERSI